MRHSEKASTLARRYSEVSSQGKRNDIHRPSDQPDNTCGEAADSQESTSAQLEQKSCSRDTVAREYGITGAMVARYLRINKLIPALKEIVDTGRIKISPAAELSYLSPDEQAQVCTILENHPELKVNMKNAQELRALSTVVKFTDANGDIFMQILCGEAAHGQPQPKP